MQKTILALYADKIRGCWRIFYQDEVGFQTEGTWGLRKKSTEVENSGKHGRINMIGAFELGTGTFYGVLTQFRVNAMRFRCSSVT